MKLVKGKEIKEFVKVIHKNIKNRYNSKTPTWIKKTADTLLLISGAMTTLGIAQGNDILSYISVGCGILGKILSNWFVD